MIVQFGIMILSFLEERCISLLGEIRAASVQYDDREGRTYGWA